MTLRDLALKYKTDKAGGRDGQNAHEYCEAYEFFLKDLQKQRFFSMLEIGIGGYHFPDRGGESLRMWREYFPDARIFALDLYEKSFTVKDVSIYQASQDDQVVAKSLYDDAKGPFAFIVDDASHINPLTLRTFEIYWPILAPGGVYAIEDVHTSYWDTEYLGGKYNPDTVMNVFKDLTDRLNRGCFSINEEEYERTAKHATIMNFDDVDSIHFFKEILFIRKKG